MLEVEYILGSPAGYQPLPYFRPEDSQSDLFGIHTHPLAIAAEWFIFDDAVNLGKQGIILAAADIFPGMDPGAELADEDVAGPDILPAEPLYSAPLTSTVAAVPGTAACLFMCHGLSSLGPGFALRCNILDGQGGIVLPVSALDLVPLATLLLEYHHLVGLTLFGDFRLHPDAIQDRAADLDILAIDDHEDIGQLNRITDIALYLFHAQCIAGSDLVLFATGANYSVHEVPPSNLNLCRTTNQQN